MAAEYLEAPVTGARIKPPPYYRITIAQVAVLVPLCSLLSFDDSVAAYSLLSGGLIAIVPQFYFAARVFRKSGAHSAKEIARSSYTGEIGKFLLTAVGFATVFMVVQPVHGLAVFTGYLVMLTIQLIGSWLLLRAR